MESNNKRIVKNTLFLYIRLVVSLLISLYTSRVILQALGFEDYGLYNLVGGFLSLLSMLTFSLGSSSMRFITVALGKGDEENLRRTFGTIRTILSLLCVFMFIVGGIIGIIAILYFLNMPAEKHAVAIYVFICSLISMIAGFMTIPYSSLINAHERMDYYAFTGIAGSVLKLVSVLLLFMIDDHKLYYYATFVALSDISLRFIDSIYCSYQFKESHVGFLFDKAIFKKIFSFSFWVGFGTIGGLLKDQGGSILLNLFYGLTLNAALGITNQIRSIVSNFGTNIGAAINPQITKSYASGNIDRSFTLTFLKTKVQGYLLMILSMPFILEIDYILSIWLGEVPEYTSLFVRLGLIACILQSTNMGYATLFMAAGRVRNAQILSFIINILYIPICYLLYKTIHTPAIVLYCTIGLETIYLFYNFAFLHKETGFPYVKFLLEVVLRFIIVSFISYAICYILQEQAGQQSFTRFIIVGFESVLVVCLTIYILGITASERKIINELILSRIKK